MAALDVESEDRRDLPSGVRALRHDDLDTVTTLHESVLRPDAPRPHLSVREHFRRTFLDHPWADPELPALVVEHEGEIVGFLGSAPRRMRLDDKPVRLAVPSALVVHPDHRSRAIGARLVRAYLAGPQDLTFVDCASDTMRQLWTGLRGATLLAPSIGWTVSFDPLGTAAAMRMLGPSRMRSTLLRGGGRALAGLGRRVPGVRSFVEPIPSPLDAEELNPSDLIDQVARAGRTLRLRPAYDRVHLEWLFSEIAGINPRARLIRRLLRSSNGRVVGWYVYLQPHRGIAQVLQVRAATGEVEPVLRHLLRDAFEQGAVGVQGRVEADQASFLAGRQCLLWPTAWVLAATADPEIAALLQTPQALLSRLDGEWWIGHHLWRDG